MAVCNHCFKEYVESEGFTAPMEVLGNILLETVRNMVSIGYVRSVRKSSEY
jgi:hypothetical protein